jgi:transcription initiation factor TFIIE subunit alpha
MMFTLNLFIRLLNDWIDYEQYYASLAASNTASTYATPSGRGSEELEEEEQKPSVQHLDSLNGYRKRSRSQEDEGAAAKKLAKIEFEPPDTNGADHLTRREGTSGADDPLTFGMYSSSFHT